jgi:LysR family transcriptional regulator of gallate degradation
MSRWFLPHARGHIDFIIGALRQDEELVDLSCEALFEEDMLILLRNEHPLLRHFDPLSQRAAAQWVLPRSNAPARRLLERAFLTLGLPCRSQPWRQEMRDGARPATRL